MGGTEGKSFLTTEPGTMWEYTARRRVRPCWRCRTYRRVLGKRRWHWGCRPLPKIIYLDTKPPD